MDSTVARVDLENRHEGVLLRVTLSSAALHELTRSGELHARMGEDGVDLLEGTAVELLCDGDAVELVRLELRIEGS